MHAIPPLRASEVAEPIFMQDNAPYHTAKIVKQFLEAENIAVMDWSVQNPDLNPIENGNGLMLIICC